VELGEPSWSALDRASVEALIEEEEEAERLYKEAVGEARREVSSDEVSTEMPDGEANR
jgi:hypothetical protein